MRFAVVEGQDVVICNACKDFSLDSLRYCQEKKGLEVYAWCVMTSHVHLIIGTHGEKIENILRDFKSFTFGQIRRAIQDHPQESRREWMLWLMERAGQKNSNNHGFQFRQQDNHPIELSTNEMLRQRLDYLHRNPVAAGFVRSPEDYLYSSARDYCGEKGLLEVMLVE